MEKLKPSEESIIKLGKKIVEELKLEPSANTLGRWMSHYVAELIHKSENCESSEEKVILERECFDTILKLWQNMEHLPTVTKPLTELEPLLELLDALKKEDYRYPFWRNFTDDYKNPTWKTWITLVKENSENIFELCLYTSVNGDLLKKKKGWLNEYKSFIKEDEKKMLEHLEYLVNRSRDIKTFTEEEDETIHLDELSPNEKQQVIFDKIEMELNEINQKFDKLRKSLTSETNE
ncbi:hypothetical protein OU798_02715 [Prolixibacteraceae bacterium Z1-6]|uniref:Uncharacterized protein n=1 Tax=Draconibacterium aestuarii TaxID=2998507 RepID=A0A9X3J4D5_9BACT|nr:hypothetical protein [Prolixibacteraceae bacterium Z1-6]